LFPGDVVHNWIGGSKFTVRAGESGLTQHIYTGLQDFSDMGYLLHALRSSDLFADVGSNLGSYTILAGAVVGARGVAFEPVPATHERLIANIRLNNMQDRITCMNIAVGNVDGVVEFTSSLGTANRVTAPGERSVGAIKVPIRTLDGILDGQYPSMMKIDVEGYEKPALEGAQETLKKASLNSVIMELNGCGGQYGHQESTILEIMHDHGFGTYSYDPWSRTLERLDGKNPNTANTIFIRDLSLARELVASAPMFTVLGKRF
jgi:FkbM family methyltransferase